jgi:hypothetical protein
MEARLDLDHSDLAGKLSAHINSAGAVLTQSSLPGATQELVKIRASQINGSPAAPTCTPSMPRTTANPRYGST